MTCHRPSQTGIMLTNGCQVCQEDPRAGQKGKGKAQASPPPDVDDSSHPTATIPAKKAAKP